MTIRECVRSSPRGVFKSLVGLACGPVSLVHTQKIKLNPKSPPGLKRWNSPNLPARAGPIHVCFSNRPFGVKRFQTIHHHSVDVAHGLVLLFGIGTKALPVWDSKTRRNKLSGGLA